MKKLLVLMLVLGLTSMVSADISVGTPLLVDVNGGAGSGEKLGWQQWEVSNSNPHVFNVDGGSYSNITAQISAMGSLGVRSRDGGMVFATVPGVMGITGPGFGTHYLHLSLSGLAPSTVYQITLWSWETTGVWSMNSTNPNSKFVEWAALNPLDWLLNNGYDGTKPGEPKGGGYGPMVGTDHPAATTDSNMPAGLVSAIAAVGGGRATLDAGANDPGDSGLFFKSANSVTFRFISSAYYSDEYPDGTADIYGWNDCTDWAGSNLTPLSGFMIVPEPATMVLLGLGGLALLRKRRA